MGRLDVERQLDNLRALTESNMDGQGSVMVKAAYLGCIYRSLRREIDRLRVAADRKDDDGND